MKSSKTEWQRVDSLFIRLKVHHFNEATARFRPKAPFKATNDLGSGLL
jgi:hypothetical protein